MYENLGMRIEKRRSKSLLEYREAARQLTYKEDKCEFP